jgi:hypothetical protein
MWINLKQAVKPNVIPITQKKRELDNHYVVSIKINKYQLDQTRYIEYTNVVPIFHTNKTADYYLTDFHHTKIPEDATYTNRAVSTSQHVHEIFAVNNKVIMVSIKVNRIRNITTY